MNQSLPLFLSARFFKGAGKQERRRKASAPAIRIATLGVALGVAVMLLTVSVVKGFKHEVSRKVWGFGAQMEICGLQTLYLPDIQPLHADTTTLEALRRSPGITGVAKVSEKMGLLKTETDFKGIRLKGMSAECDRDFLQQSLVRGRLPHFKTEGERTEEICISLRQANELKLDTGSRVYAYFFESTIKTRRFRIVGIYETNLKIFDDTHVLTSLTDVNSLNGWRGNLCSKLEVSTDGHTEAAEQAALHIARGLLCEDGTPCTAITAEARYPQIFSWLELLDFNVWVVLILMICVSGFTMVSGLFILILERINTIGVLKALGMSNGRIRLTFLSLASFIVVRGLLLGNVIGLGIALAQRHWNIVSLDDDKYYMDTVPIIIDLPACLLLNVGTLVVTVLTLIVPSYLISKIQPAKAIRFE